MTSITYDCMGETFEWDGRTSSWLWGQPHSGVGIYKQDGKWYGNVVRGSGLWILAYGPYDTAELGMRECLSNFKNPPDIA